jgi:tripartite-type tricarboxylate transporter receptor subunit TctC
MIHRRSFTALLGALALPAVPAWAAGFPEKAVRLIVPYAAGGPTDVVGRVLAEGLSAIWGQQVYVENKAGASGVLGVRALTASPPDGYNLMFTASAAFVIYPAMIEKPPYDSVTDFTAISSISYSDLILVVNERLPVNDVDELIAYIRAHPGKVSYASAGIGAVNHIGGELFRRLTQTDIVHIPYKGDAPAIVDLLSGDVTMSFMSSQLAIPQIRAGKLKPLAVSSKTRMAGLPKVPTMMEAGVKDFDLRAWNALVGPANMPPELVQQINAAVVKAMDHPDVKARLADLGLVVDTSTADAFAQRLKTETLRWRAFIKSAGIKAE